jgi:hypothetical protein
VIPAPPLASIVSAGLAASGTTKAESDTSSTARILFRIVKPPTMVMIAESYILFAPGACQEKNGIFASYFLDYKK